MKEIKDLQQSFANVVNGLNATRSSRKINFRTMVNPDKVDNSDFVLPMDTINAAKHKFENTLVGFFVGKKVAFPLVKNYVTNTWNKFRNVPRILTKWTPKMTISKDQVTRVPVWVKFHNILVVAYSEDGLSLIDTQVGTPIMLDAFTSDMKVKGKNVTTNQRGNFNDLRINNQQKEFKYQPVNRTVTQSSQEKNSSAGSDNGIKLKNLFEKLNECTLLKNPLRKLLHDQGNLHERVNLLRFKLYNVQKALDSSLNDPILREEEGVYVQAFNEAKLDEERFLKQKAKVEWLDVGDSNLAYFHKTIKSKNQRSIIETILNLDNVEVSGSM
nr:hypothetical protein [Tanacetum cinerariifolium]